MGGKSQRYYTVRQGDSRSGASQGEVAGEVVLQGDNITNNNHDSFCSSHMLTLFWAFEQSAKERMAPTVAGFQSHSGRTEGSDEDDSPMAFYRVSRVVTFLPSWSALWGRSTGVGERGENKARWPLGGNDNPSHCDHPYLPVRTL